MNRCWLAMAGVVGLAGMLMAGETVKTTDESVFFEEKFDKDLSNWVSEGPNSVEVRDGRMAMKTTSKAKDGQYLWLKKDLPADFRVEFDVTPVSPSGFFLLFFCANGVKGEDILGDKLMKEYKALSDFNKYKRA